MIQVSNNILQYTHNKHTDEPMSECEISVIRKVEELKVKICADPNVNVRMSYLNMYEELLQTYKPLELALFWKDWNHIKASLYYHRRKTNPKQPKTIEELEIKNDYTKTSNYETFLR